MDPKYAQMAANYTTWERTGEMRCIRRNIFGGIEKVQVEWRCRENGKTEWRDVPIVDQVGS